MKITTTKLKQLIREAIEDEQGVFDEDEFPSVDDDFEPNPDDYMTDAEKDHEWAETAEVTASGFDLDPMVKDQLMQMAQQIRSGALAGEGDITAAFAKIMAAAK